ncbi:hypothetical protein RDI86_01390 [Cellulosimicrobium sp. XJ-DQ-B-000]|uniref:hypothetical protein n=1 Tax=Cellulosimicrobium sp. XJ-DQ-B-000 TaxID=3072182 RepID=UPI002806D923|nr:hypothetical protein [Cellulosimicrobium sp. XJ-DQ-B-000]MDQ8040502.1 hypothetical protein [Cellulosimicrobium sp. XJ-DQ-B-000]
MTNTDQTTLSRAELDALPLGARVGFTDGRGCPGAAVKVGSRPSSGGERFSITGPTLVSSFTVAKAGAVLLEPARSAPTDGDAPVTTLTRPDQADGLEARSVLRDANGTVVENAGGPRPWLPTGFTEGIESTDLAYPVTVLWPTPPPTEADRALAAHHVEAARHRFASDQAVSKYNPELQAVRRSVLRVLDSTIKTIREGTETAV